MLAFDVTGTLLEWHIVITRALHAVMGDASPLPAVDWAAFAREYRRWSVRTIQAAVYPEGDFDTALTTALDELAASRRFALSPSKRGAVGAAWTSLPAWDDVRESLQKLQHRCRIVRFIVLSKEATAAIRRHHGFAWGEHISCDTLGVYKTHPDAYRLAAARLGTPPRSITMVACHDFDLAAAQETGFQTAYIDRPREWRDEPSPSTGTQVDDWHRSLLAFTESRQC